MTTPLTENKKETNNGFELTFNEIDLVYNIEGSNSVYLSTKKVAEEFYQIPDFDTGILPPVVRYISPDNRSVIIERSPAVHSLSFRFNESGEGKDIEQKTMALPWTVYVIRLNEDTTLYKLQIFFRNQQIWSIKDSLFSACLPNVYDSGNTCVGMNSTNNKSYKAKDLADAVNIAIANYWGGIGNLDVCNFIYEGSSLPQFIAQKMKDLPKKDKCTSKNETKQRAKDFFKVYEDLTLSDALEIQYVDQRKITVETIIKQLEISVGKNSKPNLPTNLRAYFTPILNRAKKRLK